MIGLLLFWHTAYALIAMSTGLPMIAERGKWATPVFAPCLPRVAPPRTTDAGSTWSVP
jgi:hypothetical protein